MIALRARRKTLAILAIACLAATMAAALPDNPYQRWQLLDGTIQRNARWIYERTTFDPTPIDVAVLGPSRAQSGVNTVELEAALRDRGLPVHVVNFALPETGRDLNYAIAREIFKTKAPKLLILGVIDKPSRFGHPAFKYVAPSWLVVDLGYVGNINYLANLIYLPYRQMQLFVADLSPSLTGLTKTFDPASYPGSNIDTTREQLLPEGKRLNRTDPAPHDVLMRGVRKYETDMRPPILPAFLRDVEFGDERHNIRQIAALAREKGTRIVFLGLPYYTDPGALQEESFYRQFGNVINASFLANHAEWYADFAHMTTNGASALTQWLVPSIAQEFGEAK